MFSQTLSSPRAARIEDQGIPPRRALARAGTQWHAFHSIVFPFSVPVVVDIAFLCARARTMHMHACHCVPPRAEPHSWPLVGGLLHTRQSGPMGLETAFFCHDSPLQARCRTQIRLWGFQFDGGGIIMVLEWPGGGVGRTVSGKCRLRHSRPFHLGNPRLEWAGQPHASERSAHRARLTGDGS